MGSDHFPILTEISVTTDRELPYLPKFNLDKANWPLFEHESKITIASYPHSQDPNKNYSSIINIITNAANKAIPKIRPSQKHKSVPY